MKILILTFCQLLAVVSMARITDNQVESKVVDNKIELSVKSGFHFNAEAPANAKFDDLKAVFRPKPKTEKLFVFTVPAKTKKGKLSFYVCDDKKTACEQHEMNISFNERNPSEVKPESKPEVKPDPITNIKTDKPTLIIFSAPWCPACLRMQSETYPVKSVASQFKKLIIQKINIDLPANSEIADKYHVKAIPTMVLLNKNGEEVHRWLDYQPANKFARELKANINNVVSIAQLEKKAGKGDASAISQLGMQSYLAYNCQDAIKWWGKSKKEADRNLQLAAEVQCAEDKTPDEQIKALEKGIKESTSKMDQVRWSVALLEKKKEIKSAEDLTAMANKTLNDLVALSKNATTLKKSFAESTYGEAAGFEAEEALYMKSKIYGLLDRAPDKAQALEAIKANAEKRNVSVERPGEMLMAIAYLREADEKVRVQEMYQQLLNRYPDTYVYHEKYSRYQLKNKNFDQALASVNTAIQFPEGNLPKLNLLKVRVLKEMKNKEQALSVIDSTLKMEDISHKKFKKTLAELETLKKEIEK